MDNQHFYSLYILLNLHRFIQGYSGGCNMLTPEMHYSVYKEQHKDRLREIEHQHLLQAAGLQQSISSKLYRRTVSWLGIQMVKWGSKLQSYATPDKGCQESSFKIPMMPKL